MHARADVCASQAVFQLQWEPGNLADLAAVPAAPVPLVGVETKHGLCLRALRFPEPAGTPADSQQSSPSFHLLQRTSPKGLENLFLAADAACASLVVLLGVLKGVSGILCRLAASHGSTAVPKPPL